MVDKKLTNLLIVLPLLLSNFFAGTVAETLDNSLLLEELRKVEDHLIAGEDVLGNYKDVRLLIDKINRKVFEERRDDDKVMLAAQMQNSFLYLIDKYRLPADIEILLIEKSIITLSHADRIKETQLALARKLDLDYLSKLQNVIRERKDLALLADLTLKAAAISARSTDQVNEEINLEMFGAIATLVENKQFSSVEQVLISYENHTQFNRLLYTSINKASLIWSTASAYKLEDVKEVKEAADLLHYLEGAVNASVVERYSDDNWWRIMAHGALAKRYCHFSMPDKSRHHHAISLSLARDHSKNRSRAIKWVVSAIRDDSCLSEPGIMLLHEAVRYAEEIEDEKLRKDELRYFKGLRYPGFKYEGSVN